MRPSARVVSLVLVALAAPACTSNRSLTTAAAPSSPSASMPASPVPSADPKDLRRCQNDEVYLFRVNNRIRGAMATLIASDGDTSDIREARDAVAKELPSLRTRAIHPVFAKLRAGYLSGAASIVNGLNQQLAASDASEFYAGEVLVNKGIRRVYPLVDRISALTDKCYDAAYEEAA